MNKNKLKIFIVTQNEPFFIPKMVHHILEKQPGKYEIVGYTVLSPSRKNKSSYSWFKERAVIYSYFELFIVGLAYVYSKLVTFFCLTTAYSNKQLFRKFNVKEITTQDINSDSYLSELNKIKPDIILSISCPQLFKEKLLDTPTLYCLNAHGTLLPRHRGVFGSFWTLYCNDKVAGGTLHTMELKIDAGNIIWQKELEVEKDDTQFSIAYKTKNMMAKGLVKIFEQNVGLELSVINKRYKPSYHRAPTKEQGKVFKRRGLRVLKIKDLYLMLSKSF